MNLFLDLGNLEKLDLSHNKLNRIPVGYFDSLRNLKALAIVKSGVRTIEDGAFIGCLHLEELWLYDNPLGQVSRRVLSDVPTLLRLALGMSELKLLPEDLFQDLVNIKTIDLTGNRLRSLPAHIFAGLVNLKNVDLEENQLERLPETLFEGLRLNWIGLHNNKLQELPPKLFAGQTAADVFLFGNSLKADQVSRLHNELGPRVHF